MVLNQIQHLSDELSPSSQCPIHTAHGLAMHVMVRLYATSSFLATGMYCQVVCSDYALSLLAVTDMVLARDPVHLIYLVHASSLQD